uniref:CAAX prenyl protease n=2 Tax=Plectus sambesii TaxID=2011161 RepID=A0A914WU43_9BILA
MQPSVIFKGTLFFSWLMFLWDYYLAWRQYVKHRDNEKRPDAVSEIIGEEDYRKARLYKLDRHIFGFARSIWSQLESTVILLYGFIPYFWYLSGDLIGSFGYNNEIIQSVVFILITTVLETLISLPWDMYDTFVIEELHGFNKQTVGFYLKDKAKKMGVSMLLMAPIISVVIWIVKMGGDYFFLYIWVFMSIIIFFLLTIYPEFIAPLFDKYTPLPEGVLREKIEALASRVHFPLKKLYVVEGSKRSAHSNAYMYGFWKNKRIVLYDTLLNEYTPVQREEKTDIAETAEKTADTTEEKTTKDEGSEKKESKKLGMSNDEVVAVLGHELGHWALYHTLINLIITELNLLFMLFVFGYFYQQKNLYVAFGFDTQPTIIGLLIVFQFVLSPYNEVLNFLMTLMTRRCEFAADRFSANLGYARLMQTALIKLGKDNLSIPVDDWLYSAWNHSHPPIPERVEAMKKYE